MKLRNYISLIAILFGLSAQAQVTSDPPEYEDPTTELKILIDISALDASLDHTQALLDAAADGEDLYMWTWNPAEHPTGHPLVNGLGAQPWKNSNENLKLTKESDNIYSFTMIPTDFYEVDAQTVFANDIEFLVKAKDGGGFGDPDIKSENLKLVVDPPTTTRNPSHLFPGSFEDDELVVLFYDNKLERTPGMQNLTADSAWFFAVATLNDSTELRIAPNQFRVSEYPELKMDYFGDGIFRKYMIPRKFFNVPSDKTITRMVIYVMRPNLSSRIAYDIIAELGCE